MSNEFEGPIAGSLQRHVDELLEQAPPAKGGQAEFNVTNDSASADVEANLGRGWSVGATAGWFRQQGASFSAKARKVWGAKSRAAPRLPVR